MRTNEIFYGTIAEFADGACAVIPDFIANSGMARAYVYLMGDAITLTDDAIFRDASERVKETLANIHAANSKNRRLTETAYEIALADLVK